MPGVLFCFGERVESHQIDHIGVVADKREIAVARYALVGRANFVRTCGEGQHAVEIAIVDLAVIRYSGDGLEFAVTLVFACEVTQVRPQDQALTQG
ncbi:hypothetical protein D3C85_1538120 [compost metagenome]